MGIFGHGDDVMLCTLRVSWIQVLSRTINLKMDTGVYETDGNHRTRINFDMYFRQYKAKNTIGICNL